MAHISDLHAGIYSYLDIHTIKPLKETILAEQYAALFVGSSGATTEDGDTVGVATHYRMPSVREFPSIGTPPNVVNVPVYGQPVTSQVQGQSDAPSMELTINYNAEDALEIHKLEGKPATFRFMMSNTAVTQDEGAGATIDQANTCFFFQGKVEAILVNPSLTDATTAQVTLSSQTDFVGPYTVAGS
jgi:hypothetical protein